MLLQSVLKNFTDPPHIVVDRGVFACAENLIEQLYPQSDYAIICDGNTRNLLHGHFGKSLWLELEGTPEADMTTAEQIIAATSVSDLLISLGSGTINDLCKYASFTCGKPYISFPTAPSMNGYLSSNASITVNGHKRSLSAHPPRGVFCDLDILCAAPIRLIKSGIGDSICRSTCQSDWLLSHLLLDTAYDPLPFSWLESCESELFSRAGELLAGDRNAMRLLITTLLISGLGMLYTGGSYPASQGEHLIAHALGQMKGDAHDKISRHYHGEQIAVTTLTMARMQNMFLQSDRPPVINSRRNYKNEIGEYFAECDNAAIIAEYENKCEAMIAHDAAEKLRRNWHDIRRSLSAVAKDTKALEEILRRCDAPAVPADISCPDELYRQAIICAPLLRNRFTFLDLKPDSKPA